MILAYSIEFDDERTGRKKVYFTLLSEADKLFQSARENSLHPLRGSIEIFDDYEDYKTEQFITKFKNNRLFT